MVGELCGRDTDRARVIVEKVWRPAAVRRAGSVEGVDRLLCLTNRLLGIALL